MPSNRCRPEFFPPEVGNAEQIQDPGLQAHSFIVESPGLHPAAPAIGQLNMVVGPSSHARNHPVAPYQRTDQWTAARSKAHLSPQPRDPRRGHAAPVRGSPGRHLRQAPCPHPPLVAVRFVLDQTPRTGGVTAAHAHHFTHQQLAPHLALVGRAPAYVECGETHHAVGNPRAAHSAEDPGNSVYRP
jgi:hypothetical protein